MTASIATTKVCPACNYELPISYFISGRILCDSCRGAVLKSAPWTDADISRLQAAVSNVLTMFFVVCNDGLTEPQRELFRELIDASDRRANRRTV